jgi:hypothetical protein
MPTDLPPDYKPRPMPDSDTLAPGSVPTPPGTDSPRPQGECPQTGPDIATPGIVPSRGGLPTF